MIETFEIAPTSASACHLCHEYITKGEARGIEYYSFRQHTGHRYYCLKCSKKMIKELLKEAGKYLQFK